MTARAPINLFEGVARSVERMEQYDGGLFWPSLLRSAIFRRHDERFSHSIPASAALPSAMR
jgi:hypothetical protein